MKSKSLLCLGACLLCFSAIFSQNAEMFGFDSRRITVKSPNAASLDAFSRLGINYATGIPDVNVPIYDVELDNVITLPIRIKYHASGFKFGEMPSVAGFKWALDAGGMISRDINGMDDSDWFFDHYDSLSYYINLMRNDATEEGSTEQLTLKNFMNNRIDVNQDYYSLNYFRGSTNLLYKKGKWYAENAPYQLKIEGFNEFVVTDELGYKYYFGGSGDNYYETSDASHASVPGNNDPLFNDGHISTTSWMLKRIVTPVGKQMNFEYIRYNLPYVQHGISETYTKGVPFASPTTCGCPSPVVTTTTNGGTYATSLIARIYTGDTEVSFSYSDNNALQYWKKQLDSVVVKHIASGKRIRKFAFEYGSFSSVFLKLTKVHQVNVSDTADKQTWSFEYDESSTMPALNSYARDIFGYYNGAVNSRLIVSSHPQYTQTYQSANRTPNLTRIKLAMLHTIRYPTGGKAVLDYELNEWSGRYAPGIRIKQITRFTSQDSVADRTRYEYSNLTGGISTFSIPFETRTLYNCMTYVFKSDYPLNERIAKNFYYGTVKEKQIGSADTLVKQFDYEAYVNAQGQYSPYLVREVNYKGTSTEKLAETYNVYQIEEVDTLQNPSVISLGSSSTYAIGLPTPYCFTRYDGIQEMAPMMAANLLLSSTQTTTYSSSGNLQTKDTFLYQSNGHRYITETQRTTSKGLVQIKRSKYVQDYLSIASPSIPSNEYFIYDTMKARNMKGIVLEQEEITNGVLSYKTRNYYHLGSDNFIHPDRQQVFFRDNSFKELTKFNKFSGDKVLELKNPEGITNSFVWEYLKQHLTAQVINAASDEIAYSVTFDSPWSSPIGSTLTVEPDAPLNRPCMDMTPQVGVIETENLNLNSNKEYLVTYWEKNCELTISSGTIISNKILQTKGNWHLREIRVTGISGNAMLLFDPAGFIQELRLYPVNAQITTYTYTPLIGITSQCDASNKIIYYEYDGFGRLKLIRDENKNVVQQFDYKYQQPINH
jgi:hypothetical protein